MGGKQMEGDNKQRRKAAADAREEGNLPSDGGATLGASKQRKAVPQSAGHVERLETIREGKLDSVRENTPQPRPGSGSRG
jgi:hypothetical protein